MGIENVFSKKSHCSHSTAPRGDRRSDILGAKIELVIADTKAFIAESKSNRASSLKLIKQFKAFLIELKSDVSNQDIANCQLTSSHVEKIDRLSGYIGDLYSVFSGREAEESEVTHVESELTPHERYLIQSTSLFQQVRKEMILVLQDLCSTIFDLLKVVLTTVDAVSSLDLVKALLVFFDGSILSKKSVTLFDNLRLAHRMYENDMVQHLQNEVEKVDRVASQLIARIYSRYIGHRSYAMRRKHYLAISRLITLHQRVDAIQKQLNEAVLPSLSKEMEKLRAKICEGDLALRSNRKKLMALQNSFVEMSQLSESTFSLLKFLKNFFSTQTPIGEEISTKKTLLTFDELSAR